MLSNSVSRIEYPSLPLLRNVILYLDIAGTFRVQISTVNMTLYAPGQTRPIAVWPLLHLRRYGKEGARFTFEAGRKCPTGPGSFSMQTNNSIEMFNLVDKHVRSMASQSTAQQPAAASNVRSN